MENTANAAMRVIGIMSGTSVDAIDGALCEFIPQPYGQSCTLGMRLLGYREQPFPDFLRQLVLSTVRHDICSLPDLTTSDSLHHIGKEQHTCRQTQKLYLVL
jgi:1,6-anhydro-N-acetylmuramate kinase